MSYLSAIRGEPEDLLESWDDPGNLIITADLYVALKCYIAVAESPVFRWYDRGKDG
jgi:hypothetical protein